MLASDRNVIKQVYLAMNLELFNAGHGRVARLRYQALWMMVGSSEVAQAVGGSLAGSVGRKG